MELKVIDYETAKLAKDVGFEKGWCDVAYREDDKKLYMDTGMYTDYPAPTQEVLRKWLRDEHNIHIQIRACDMIDDYSSKVYKEYDYKSDVRSRWSISFKSYEQALEAGLKEALKYLLDKKSEL